MSPQVTDTSAVAEGTREVGIVVIGSGFAGLGAAIRLSQAGRTDFVVLERGDDVGGTWRDNTYPGAACDVPSQLYSYSFAPNKQWSRSFSPQPEIQRYIQSVADKYKIRDKHVFGCDVQSVRWDESAHRWKIQTSKGDFSARFVVSAVGALCEPALPDIKGIGSFEGQIFHSARWDHDSDLAGKRVAVIGTGASAIQIVPQVAKIASRLDVYQRTAPWVLPRVDREYTAAERFAYKNVPGFQKLARLGVYATRETQVVGLAKAPVFMKPIEWLAKAHLRRQISDPVLRGKVTPNFRIGCKRMLISNNYFPALSQPNVDVVTDGIDEVTANAVVAKDGTRREVDAIIVATGFHVTDSPTFEHIYGRDGVPLSETFAKIGQQGYKGTTVSGYPNMFFLVGPNTGLGHSSMVYMIESQINYVVDAMRAIDRYDIGTVEVRRDVQDRYNADLQSALSSSVWMNGGCASWYLDEHGNNTTLWPGFTFQFRDETKKFDLIAYDTVSRKELAAAPAAKATATKAKAKPAANAAAGDEKAAAR
ncbi:NAD(P)/FAD-dependent oxidoreductase [Rhodococcus rhodnii]|nr:NAD(P)/FAD-dependent oxidoreductase [Rhodococcus rhodnii]TXG91741.1 NAD(P)/FAD-dependent oxidoreductase [Rhodococcus rhodnii]